MNVVSSTRAQTSPGSLRCLALLHRITSFNFKKTRFPRPGHLMIDSWTLFCSHRVRYCRDSSRSCFANSLEKTERSWNCYRHLLSSHFPWKCLAISWWHWCLRSQYWYRARGAPTLSTTTSSMGSLVHWIDTKKEKLLKPYFSMWLSSSLWNM